MYYHNTLTGESSWQKPAGFEGGPAAGPGLPTPVSSDKIPTTGWSEVTCSDGRKYYYHAQSEVSPSKRTLYLGLARSLGRKRITPHAEAVPVLGKARMYYHGIEWISRPRALRHIFQKELKL